MNSESLSGVLPVSWASLADERTLALGTLRASLEAQDGLLQSLLPHLVIDRTRPYGRNVLLEGESLEVMVASWTPGQHCQPHDHGGSQGLVQVLRGRARHRVYTLQPDGLKTVKEEIITPGQCIACGRDLVHSMGDDGAAEPLVTLHMYVGPIPHMAVYDLDGDRTLLVDGACGAWIPDENSGLILRERSGILPINALL